MKSKINRKPKKHDFSPKNLVENTNRSATSLELLTLEKPTVDQLRKIERLYLHHLRGQIDRLYGYIDGEIYFELEDYCSASDELETLLKSLPQLWPYDLKAVFMVFRDDIFRISDEFNDSDKATVKTNLAKAASIGGYERFQSSLDF